VKSFARGSSGRQSRWIEQGRPLGWGEPQVPPLRFSPVPRHAGAGGMTIWGGGGGGCGGGGGGGANAVFLLLPKPGGGIDVRGDGRGSGFVLCGGRTTTRDQAFDGCDQGEGLDLAGHAAAGHFGGEAGEFPEAGEDPVAGLSEPVLLVHGTPGQVRILLDKLLANGSAVLKQVGADTRLGFGVRSGVGVETGGLRGLTVGHGSREDQAGEGYFLVSDGVGDFIFGHGCSVDGKVDGLRAGKELPLRRQGNKKSRRGGMLVQLIERWFG
jgi:hypothetical protein